MPFVKENPVQFFFNVGSQESWIKAEITGTRLTTSGATITKPYVFFIIILFFYQIDDWEIN